MMTKKWKVFGIQTNVEWYDIKTKIKQLLRRLTYSWLVQQLICLIILSYMRLVYYSSKKVFVNDNIVIEAAKNKTPLIFVFWHNRLMMTPFTTKKSKKVWPEYNLMTLASKHGDGQFVGKVMGKMGLIPVYGSSKDGRKAGRGIEMKSLRQIMRSLKNGISLGITPDGPRGPNQKIGGEVVNISRISGAKILPTSYSTSRHKKLRTWDKFYIPLPFSTLCFYFDESLIEVPKNVSDQEMETIKNTIENRMNFVQTESERIAKKNRS